MPANPVMNMLPGEAITELPVGELIEKIGIGIAEAQLSLDQMSVRVASMMSERNIDFRDSDGETRTYSLLELGFSPTFYHFSETEITVTLTLQMRVEQDFSIGGSVDFDASKSTTNTASMGADIGGQAEGGAEMGAEAEADGLVGKALGSIGLSQSTGLSSLLGGSIGGDASSTTNKSMAFGATIDASYSRKYEFDMSGSSTVKTRLITVPPPTTFIDAVKRHARAGGTMELDEGTLDSPADDGGDSGDGTDGEG